MAEAVSVDVGHDPERAMIARHAAGDHRAFPELIEAYRRRVYGYLVRSGIEASQRDDVFQEIFLRVHGAAARFDGAVRPWIFTIVVNTVRTHFRKQRVRAIVSLDRGPLLERAEDPAPNGEALSLAKETADFMERAIDALPFEQREVVLLACVERMSMEDVAAALDIPESTAKTRLRRARIALASQLARRHAREDREISR